LPRDECGCHACKKRDRGTDLTRIRESPHGHSAQIPGLAFAALRVVQLKTLKLHKGSALLAGKAALLFYSDKLRGDVVFCL
jgi:hypothetical protein